MKINSKDYFILNIIIVEIRSICMRIIKNKKINPSFRTSPKDYSKVEIAKINSSELRGGLFNEFRLYKISSIPILDFEKVDYSDDLAINNIMLQTTKNRINKPFSIVLNPFLFSTLNARLCLLGVFYANKRYFYDYTLCSHRSSSDNRLLDKVQA